MYEVRSRRVMLKYKFDRIILQQMLVKVDCMIMFANLIDTLFIEAVLQRNSLVKRLFVLDIEHN